ncbi:MAG: PDZ domain-containing protein, partial [Acidobacteria bacterium]|nr:PDZ domain-containing protein [Acidobacteriota bacterium]
MFKTTTPPSRRAAAAFLTICALAACLAFPRAGASSAARVSADTREGRITVFDDVWVTISSRYYDPATRGVDWAAARAEFRPLAADARTQTDFYRVLRRMIATLRDAHTRVYAPGEPADWERPAFVSVGVSLREIEGRVVVARVERGSEAERAGIKAGDEISRVDGEAARAVVARRAADGVVASTDAASRLSAVAHLFDGAPASLAAVELTDARGDVRDVTLRRTLETRAPQLDARRTGSVAVVRFDLFTPGIAARFVRALGGDDSRGDARGSGVAAREPRDAARELRGARALVLDLRANGGGESEAMVDVASALLPAGAPLGVFTDREGRAAASPRARRAMLFAADAIPVFRGAVVVLTGTRTASAAEILVAALKDAGRARVVGEQTCGCVLAVRERHRLPDGGALDVSELDYRTARGARLEGTGVAPDETITPTRADITRGRD